MASKIVDKQLIIDGKKRFPYIAYTMVDSRVQPQQGDNAFLGTIHMGNPTWGDGGQGFLNNAVPKFVQAGVYWTVAISSPSNCSAYFMTPAQRDSPFFLGYNHYDEPDLHGYTPAQAKTLYDQWKQRNPNHVILMNVYDNLVDFTNVKCCDAIFYDLYPLRDTADRKSFAIRWEERTWRQALQYRQVSSFPIPIWAVTQAVGTHTVEGSGDGTIQDVEPREYRCQFYLALTMGFYGVLPWTYSGWSPNGANIGLVSKPSLLAEARRIGVEVKQYEVLLCQENIGIGWRGKRDSVVSISPNPTISGGGVSELAINYCYKPGLLILVNKSWNSISNVSVKVQNEVPMTLNFSPYEVKIIKQGNIPDPQDEDDNNNNTNNGEPIMIEYNNKTEPIRETSSAVPYQPPFSIAMRLRLNSLAQWTLLYSKEGSWSAEVAPDPHKDGRDGLFCLEIRDITDVFSTIKLQPNVEIHLGIVYEGTTVRFYENGILKTTKTQTMPPHAPIGSHEPQGMNGTIINCKVWNTALSDAEILADYTGTAPIKDIEPPIITLLGANPITVPVGSTYTDPGATALDNIDGNVPVTVYTGALNVSNPGVYSVTFNARDNAGNEAITKTRTVNVVESLDTQDPVITLLGDNPIEITIGTAYIEPGASAVGAYGESVPVVISGTVDINTVGDYPIYYTATDARGNSDSIRRYVCVRASTPPPPPPVPFETPEQLIRHICQDIIGYLDLKD